MPRKFDITEMKAKLAKYDERKRNTEKALSKIETSRKELVAKIAAEERKERTHNLCEVGGLVYKYFGENLTAEQFKAILDVLFKMNGVQELSMPKRTSVLWLKLQELKISLMMLMEVMIRKKM
ncbi:MAG: DUF3847 domain-containing protein [Ruminiclostridium sp.]|nr:DUF3847 domain-containing protein [Ruminiclostridium sp.]